ncbi:hypothetical protein BX600DRAFT_507108 [Xylariales sp. PMI_506]|nr:hypothetical protein BX600DRAFT_507108 [Xylariales sp. PMI_506]
MSHRTDEELDRDWQPNGRRPQSTIARSFSAELMDIFRIENSVADLDQQVDKRKQEVTSQASELEALERRIREMEDRLRRSQQVPAATSPRQRVPVGGAFGDNQQQAQQLPAHPEQKSRPGTAKAPAHQGPVHGGAMPPTPTASEGEYELVPDDDGRSIETRSFTDMVIVSKDGDHDQ